MKKTIKTLLSIVVVTGLMLACNLDKSAEQDLKLLETEGSLADHDPLLKSFLTNHSIDKVNIDRWEEGYLLDNCVYVSDDELLERSKTDSPRHFGKRIDQPYTSFGLISTQGSNKRNITFRFAPVFPVPEPVESGESLS